MLCQVPQRSALVILSGGQDSFVSLLLAKEQCGQVSAVTFDYGQQHREVSAAVKIEESFEEQWYQDRGDLRGEQE